MNAKSRKAEQKRNYERMKDINNRMKAGEPTTFAERQAAKIYNDRKNKKK